jgi:hypothetical protein
MEVEMTPEDVKRRVEKIRNSKGDDELAHSLEDELHADVLRAIAASTAHPADLCAKAALETLDIPFARWCA